MALLAWEGQPEPNQAARAFDTGMRGYIGGGDHTHVQLTFSDNGPDESGLGHWRSSPHIPGSRTKLLPGSCPQEREGRQNGLGRRPVGGRSMA